MPVGHNYFRYMCRCQMSDVNLSELFGTLSEYFVIYCFIDNIVYLDCLIFYDFLAIFQSFIIDSFFSKI